MDEKLINEYINNLANQVNALTQENILLKTRLAVIEKREQEKAPEPTPKPTPPLVSKEEG